MKPGYRTTEFWLTLLATIVGMLTASGAFADAGPVGKGLALVASALAAAGYSYSRAQVKAAPAHQPLITDEPAE